MTGLILILKGLGVLVFSVVGMIASTLLGSLLFFGRSMFDHTTHQDISLGIMGGAGLFVGLALFSGAVGLAVLGR